jgi:hypothetical protein
MYIGTKAGACASGVVANGAAARKITTEISMAARAIRTSREPASSVDKNTLRSVVNSPGRLSVVSVSAILATMYAELFLSQITRENRMTNTENPRGQRMKMACCFH